MARRFLTSGFMFLTLGFIGQPIRAAQAAAQEARQPAATPANQGRAQNEKAKAKAAREIGKSGDASGVPTLVADLRDPSVKVRREVVIALAQFRVPAALDALLSATQDADSGVRLLAVKGAVGYYTGVSPSTGFTGFFKKQYRRAKTRFVPENTQIDPGIPVDPKVVTALVRTMNDRNFPQVAREAAKGLGILLAQPAVPDLVKAAHSSDQDLARESLNSLAKIKDRSAGPALLDLLNSPDKDVRRDASVTVGILRTRDAVPKLQAIFESDSDQKDKEKALEGLAYLGDPVSVPSFIRALWREDKSLRISAAEGLARAGDPKTFPELQKALGVEKDKKARLADEFALAALGKEDYLAAIVHELASKLYGDIARAYLIELARDEKFLPKLYPFLSEQDPTVRKRLCSVLMYSGNQSTLEHLERLSHDSNGEVAAAALRAAQAIRVRTSGPAPATPAHKT